MTSPVKADVPKTDFFVVTSAGAVAAIIRVYGGPVILIVKHIQLHVMESVLLSWNYLLRKLFALLHQNLHAGMCHVVVMICTLMGPVCLAHVSAPFPGLDHPATKNMLLQTFLPRK